MLSFQELHEPFDLPLEPSSELALEDLLPPKAQEAGQYVGFGMQQPIGKYGSQFSRHHFGNTLVGPSFAEAEPLSSWCPAAQHSAEPGSYGYTSGLPVQEDYAYQDFNACALPPYETNDVGAQWHVKHESGMYQEPQFPQGQVYSHGDVKDKFASPFAASGVQVEEMSHNYFPSEFPAPAYSQKSDEFSARADFQGLASPQSLHRHSAPSHLAAASQNAQQQEHALDWCTYSDYSHRHKPPDRDPRKVHSRGKEGDCMPSQLQTARTSRRRLSLPSSTVNKPLKRARNSDPTAAATQNDDYYGMKRQSSQPRSRSEGVRIVSGRGDFDFPAWKPHDDKPFEQKLCLKIRSNKYLDPLEFFEVDDAIGLDCFDNK